MSETRAKAPPAVVAVGASAGGVEALSSFVGSLPAELAASVLVVLHISARTPSLLPQVLARAGPLPAAHAEDGEALVAGHIYIAPPDFHLRVVDGRLRLDGGPQENGVRPAIDPLFRSLATAYGRRTVGVVLSGMLDDGTAGLAALRRAGGTCYVQDPGEASFPSMPESAARVVEVQAVATAAELGKLVDKRVAEIVEERTLDSTPPGPMRSNAARHGVGAAGAGREQERRRQDRFEASEQCQEGISMALSCPECGGSLWERSQDGVLGYRCRVGHAYAPESLLSRQAEAFERALWSAVVALEERADLCERLIGRFRGSDLQRLAEHYQDEAIEARHQAKIVNQAIEDVIRTTSRE